MTRAKAKAAPFRTWNVAAKSRGYDADRTPRTATSAPRRLNKRDRPNTERMTKNSNQREKYIRGKIAKSKSTDEPLPNNWRPRKYGRGDGPKSYSNNEVAALQDQIVNLQRFLFDSGNEDTGGDERVATSRTEPPPRDAGGAAYYSASLSQGESGASSTDRKSDSPHGTNDVSGLAPAMSVAVGYVYLMHVLEHVRAGENILKVGKSANARSDMRRILGGYPKVSVCWAVLSVRDPDKAEAAIKREFMERFIPRPDVGSSERYEGDFVRMVEVFARVGASFLPESVAK
jgi:hypothetical protein